MKKLLLVFLLSISANAIDMYVRYIDKNDYIKAIEETEKYTNNCVSMWFEVKNGKLEKKNSKHIMFLTTVCSGCARFKIIEYRKNGTVSNSSESGCDDIVPNTIGSAMVDFINAVPERRREDYLPVKFFTGDLKCLEVCALKYNREEPNTSETKKEQWVRCVDDCPNHAKPQRP